jgi:hypothetical protein
LPPIARHSHDVNPQRRWIEPNPAVSTDALASLERTHLLLLL